MDFTLLEKKLKEIRVINKSLTKEIEEIKKGLSGKGINRGIENWWWKRENNYVVMDEGYRFHIDLPQNKYIYISYKEQNINFSLPPDTPITIMDDKFECIINGKCSDSLKVTLYLIGYKDSRKISMYNIPFNTKQTINNDNDRIENYRLALKLEGSGYLDLQNIQIGNIKIEGFPGSELKNNREPKPELKIEDHFKRINTIDIKDLIVQPLFSDLLEVNEECISATIYNKGYAYIQNSSDPFFKLNPNDFIKIINFTSYYQVGLSAITTGDISFELLLLGFNEHSPVEVRAIKKNTIELIKFNKEVTSVKILFRVQGIGTISKIKIGINEQKKQPDYTMDLSLSTKDWFNVKPTLTKIHDQDDELGILADTPITKSTYISYKIKNSNFSKVPTTSEFEVKSDASYEIYIKATISDSGSLVPILITYSEDQKEKVINLKLNELNYIKFDPSIRYCRIAFKVSGTGQFSISKFTLTQYPVLKTSGEIKWNSPKEIALLGLVPLKELNKIKMAAIFDEFTSQCFAHECELITFSPDNWKEVLIEGQPDLLIVESAWRGNNGTWVKKVQYQGENSIEELRELITWCKENNIPTVFWNKEDPVHYNHFIETAKLFDVVLTTDENMVPVYKEACGHNQVEYLQFAAQPTIHNPITIGERENAASFAGSYYKKHIERSKDMMNIFNAALPYGLAIFDRNFEKVKQGLLPNNRFPEHIEQYIRGTLKYYEIDKAYKGFKVTININTVKNSPTMFARRVYESLASGTPVVSNYSEGIECIFGDIVCTSENEQVIQNHLQMLFEDTMQYQNIVLEGIRRVLNNHTYSHRLEKIVNLINLPFYRKEMKVLVISIVNTPEEIDSIYTTFKKQKYGRKELCLIVSDDFNVGLLDQTEDDETIQMINEIDFYNKYQNIIEFGEFDYLSYLNPSIEYDSNYLLDLTLASLYAPWEIITVSSKNMLYFGQLEKASPECSIFKRDIFSLFSSKEMLELLIEKQDLNLIQQRGARILGIPSIINKKGVEVK